jgi:beta-lactamase superfamily II metal-dependent hydrolase
VPALIGDAKPSVALEPGPNDVYVRVVDVGPALCTVTEIPGGHYMVYDTGHWNQSHCFDAVQQIVDGNDIDLMVISHSDGDHVGEADDILGAFEVQQIIRTGVTRTTNAWITANAAIVAAENAGASVMNLQTDNLVPGTVIQLGQATVTLVAGWGEWDGPGLDDSEMLNVVSVVVRLAYRGNSVLFAGDTVGRHIGDEFITCAAAEQFMFENSALVPIRSDVLIAPHHGADNGSSSCFIVAVDPEYVIFPAGSHDGWAHPRQSTVNRYLAHGIPWSNLFRTDRGDDEPGDLEWKDEKTVTDCNDPRGDDDVDIVLPFTGPAQVDYRLPSAGC